MPLNIVIPANAGISTVVVRIILETLPSAYPCYHG